MKRFVGISSCTLFLLLAAAGSAGAQSLNCANGSGQATCACDVKIESVALWTFSTWEGSLGVRLELVNPPVAGQRLWILCNVNEGRKTASGADETVAKNGVEMSAIYDQYQQTCAEVNNLVTLGFVLRKTVRMEFKPSIFPSCTDVLQWGGQIGLDGDDPSGRLGAWDALHRVELLNVDVP
jgi:hypothetical protein